MEDRIIQAVIGLTGYDAIRAMCHAFHKYATENQGIFSAMLWYNQSENEQTREVLLRRLNIERILRRINFYLQGGRLSCSECYSD